MRHVAGLASLGSHRLMFVDEGPALIDVAVIADLVLGDGRAQLMGPLGAVRVMAIGALDQTFVHAMPKGHRKLWPLLLMAPIAEFGLALNEQELPRFRVVWRMARNAGDIVSGMH